MRPAGLFAAPRAPGLSEAPEVPPGLPAPVAPFADVPALAEDAPAPVENAPASVDDTPVPVDDAPAPLHDALFLTNDARFKSLEADRVSGAASAAPRPARHRVQSPAREVDAPERPASAPPVTPETVDVSTIKLLRKSFDLVVGVEVIEQQDLKGLQLLGKFPFNPNMFPVLCQRKTIPTIEIHPSQWVSWRAYPYVWRVIAISLTRLHLDLFQPARGIIALFPLVWPY